MIPRIHNGTRRTRSGTWTPDDLSNCVAFYSADTSDNFTFSSGTIISQWDDLSGNSNHLSATGSPELNGTVVEHDNDEHLESSISNSESTCTLCYGGNQAETTTGAYVYSLAYHDESNSRRFGISKDDGTDDHITIRFGNGRGASSSDIMTNHIVCVTYETKHSNSTLRVNGEVISVSYNNPNNTITVSNLDTLSLNDSDVSGTIGESRFEFVLLCLPKISSSDQEKVEGWWAHTFNHTGKLPEGHTYKSSAP